MKRRGRRDRDLRSARELAEIDILDTALRVMGAVLLHDYHHLDFAEDDPPNVCSARRIVGMAEELRRELRRYRRIVTRPSFAPADDLPF